MSALAGMRVVELCDGIAGPFAARLLADLGADVVKVEPPEGDLVRGWEPLVRDANGVETSALFEFLNWNKRSIVGDGGTALELAASADVVIESVGVDVEALRAVNPALVVTSVSGFGRTGPHAHRRGSDLVHQATSGLMSFSGSADREPLKRGLRQSHYEAGLNAAYATLAAHLGGGGAWIDVSIRECVASELVLSESFYASMGAVNARRPERRDPLGGPLGGGDALPSADGWVAVQISGVVSIEQLAELLREPRLAGPAFATTEARLEHVDELNALLADALAGEPGREFFLRASEEGYLTGVMQGARELLDCPQLRARGVFHTFDDLPGLEFPAVLAQPSRTPASVRTRAPRLGQHTDEVLAEKRQPTARPRGAGAPLEGVRVLDLSYVFATPYLGGLLADLGAEVIKIEAPHRLDQTRSSFSPFLDNDTSGDYWNRAGVFHVVNRGKRSLALDLGREEGREVLRELVRRSDVLLENFTPRVMRKWELTWDELRELNPRLVMLSNTGYGATGPFAAFRAQGTTLEATMGISHYAGYPGGVPTKVGQSYPDFLACWSGLVAVLAALVERRSSGEGQWIDLGMYQLGATMVAEGLLRFQATGEEPARAGNADLDAPFAGVFRAAGEDRWVAVAAADEEEVTGLTGADVAAWVRKRDGHDAVVELQAAGIAAGVVMDQRDLLADPHLRARGFHERVDCGDGIARPLLGRPYVWHGEHDVRVRGAGPAFGEAADDVLRGLLGYDDDTVARLRAGGVVVDAPVDARPLLPLDLDVMVRSGALARIDDDYLQVGAPAPAATGGLR